MIAIDSVAQCYLSDVPSLLLVDVNPGVLITLPVKMDNGETKIFHAYRIQYNHARGPAKGGIHLLFQPVSDGCQKGNPFLGRCGFGRR